VAAQKESVINLIGSADTLSAIRVWLDDNGGKPPREKTESGRRARNWVVLRIDPVEDEAPA
jgi:hypothetical protein